MSDKPHCPHMTAEVCSVCQDLEKAVELLREAQGLLKAHWGPGGTLRRINAFLLRYKL
jgi:hypothetical protein